MKRWIALAFTILILGLILAKVDRHALWQNLRATRPWPFAAAMLLFAPQNVLIAWRWKSLASNFAPVGWKSAFGMIFAGNAMNVVLPSKMGDLAKAYFLSNSGALDMPRAASLVVFEKSLDLASLCVWALAGAAAATLAGIQVGDARAFALLAGLAGTIGAAGVAAVTAIYFIPAERMPILARAADRLAARPRWSRAARLFSSGHEVMAMLQARGARRTRVCIASLALWGLHLLQIYFFFLSLNAPVPALPFAALMPLAIFAGLLPLSLFGMGTRDAAIILLFSAYHPPEILAGVGLYVSLRYLVPAAAGLPFLNSYLALAKPANPARR